MLGEIRGQKKSAFVSLGGMQAAQCQAHFRILKEIANEARPGGMSSKIQNVKVSNLYEYSYIIAWA